MKTNVSFESAVKRVASWPVIQGAGPNDLTILERLMDTTLAYLLQDDAEEKILHLLDQLEEYLNQSGDTGNPFMVPTVARIPVIHPQALSQYVNWVLGSRSAAPSEIVRMYRHLTHQNLPNPLATLSRPLHGGPYGAPAGGPVFSPGLFPDGWGNMSSGDARSWNDHQSHPAAQSFTPRDPSPKTEDNADGHGRAMDMN